MSFELPPLPYAKNALAPHMSEQTMEFHYEKHHRGYVTKLNGLVEGTPLATRPLEDLIRDMAHQEGERSTKIFNNAAQVWNHDFFWHSMTPGGGGQPGSEVDQLIRGAFGDMAGFEKAFVKAATELFGSGYVWLVYDGGLVRLQQAQNAWLPLAEGKTALLGCDVWEHAYYLDYQNKREKFAEVFLQNLVDWDAVEKRLPKDNRRQNLRAAS